MHRTNIEPRNEYFQLEVFKGTAREQNKKDKK
jgi:hypothetical protein